jgi:hypothetical protein
MATLIPAISTCHFQAGERRVAERLEQKLDDDYLVWFDVPIGPKRLHPDFVVLHPRRGLLVLEVKAWKLDTIIRGDKQSIEIWSSTGTPTTVPNPLEQARQHTHAVVDRLKTDPQLVWSAGSHAGNLAFPWSYGVILSDITRRQFDQHGLDQVLEPHRVVCTDEMTDAVDPEQFQIRLWSMFPHLMRGAITLPQIDRIRWHLFPEIRVGVQGSVFDEESGEAAIPDLIKVMDLQQEQLARSLGDGHRVIHGVAGSGKTMILTYRAELLAQTTTPAKPVLVLCFNKLLAAQLDATMRAKGIADRVHARNLHKWCRDQLVTYHASLPPHGARDYSDQLIERAIRAVEQGEIPAAQYHAVLIDEGHDFRPEWLKLVTQMVDPKTDSLLLLYDDAQNIYGREREKRFSFKSVGVQAQGRTTVLRINYRNTRQILLTASSVAADLLRPQSSDDDGVPLLAPVSCGRDGLEPIVIRLPSPKHEAPTIADHLGRAHDDGHAWKDMAILCRHHDDMHRCAAALRHVRIPHRLQDQFAPDEDAIKVMTMHASKGLEFPVVALAGVSGMPAEDCAEPDEARLFYVAATRATDVVIIPVAGDSGMGARLRSNDHRV